MSGHRGRAGRPTGSALLLASPPPYCFSPVSPTQDKVRQNWSSSRRRQEKAKPWGPGRQPGQICALSQAPGPQKNILSPRPPVGNDPSLE